MNKTAFRQPAGSLATRIATAILLKDKEISVSEIRAIPFVESDEEAMVIAKQLGRMFNVEVRQIKATSPVSQWIDILKLKEESSQRT